MAKSKKSKARDDLFLVSKGVKERFFLDFSVSHREWLRELVQKYKEHGVFPVFPTQIIEYYPDNKDKEIAIFSTFCMSWRNGNEIQQIAAMRKIMGDSPYEWFMNREFSLLSVGREQMNKLDGCNVAEYWKIAKVFDILYDFCYDGRKVMLPSEAFKANTMAKYVNEIVAFCEIKDSVYKQGVVELVLRTTDCIGSGLWYNSKAKVKCPVSDFLKKYMKEWFPDWNERMWTWDEAVGLYGLETSYDFFYAYFAHQELANLDTIGCRRYATRYHYRWKNALVYARRYWLGAFRIAPIIKFE